MRNSNSNLDRELAETAGKFQFFEMIRLLYRVQADAKGSQEFRIKYRKAPTKSFPAGEIQGAVFNKDVVELSTNVIGLFGAGGILPYVDKDLVDGRDSNELLKDFLDVFNGRIIEMLGEAWKKNRPAYGYEFAKLGDTKQDVCMKMSLAISGVEAQTSNMTVPVDTYVPSTGLLCRRIVTASGIERFLGGQFDFPISVKEFCKSKLHLSAHSRSRLPLLLDAKRIAKENKGLAENAENRFVEDADKRLTDANNLLGETAMLGGSVTGFSQRFEIKIGPLNKNEFQSMCPFGQHRVFSRFVELVRTSLSHPLDFDVRLVAQPEAVLASSLQLNSRKATRLGFDSWLCSRAIAETRQDSIKRFYWDKN